MGLDIKFEIQKPDGIAEAFKIGENFLDNNPSALVLGDNIYYGNELSQSLIRANTNIGATIFVYNVAEPSLYGVVEWEIKIMVLKKLFQLKKNLNFQNQIIR